MTPVYRLTSLAFAAAICVGLAWPAPQALALDGRAEPEAATGLSKAGKTATATRHMIAAANPHAARAGLAMLRRGGAAIDAAIAAQMVLNLVEPQSSGIGGGLFALYWDAGKGRLTSFDGRETAPMAATPERFLKSGGEPMKFRDAVFSGLSIGVPGALKALALAHGKYGKLPWEALFQPAIALARNGFAVSPRLHGLLARNGPERFGKVARAYFFSADGRPRPVGHLLQNPAFADALELIVKQGPGAFYTGPLAERIVKAVKAAPNHAGDMRASDLAQYRAYERPPVCAAYRGHKVCGMGPPSSGALTVGQVLGLLERFDLGKTPLAPRALHLIAEAQKLAYADRKRYMADADFVPVPKGLLDGGYLATRAKLVDPARTMGKASPGEAPRGAGLYGRDGTRENNGTSHISIIDSAGNALSMTSSIEGAFGARVMVSGFLLNNELTDFAFRPRDKAGVPVANRVQPGKRPRSSMAPTIVFGPDGRVKMVVGSPGGSRIILYVLKAVIGHLDWGLGAGEITALPNFGSRNGPFEVEKATVLDAAAEKLRAYGHKVKASPMTSGIHVIIRNSAGLTGAADPRREGVAAGD